MSVVDEALDISSALGNGVYAIGQDIVFGFQRTGQGYGLGEDGRVGEIGYENQAMVELLQKVAEYGITDPKSPLHQVIYYVLENYYSHLPESVLNKVASEARVGVAYAAGRLVIGKKLARAVAVRVAVAIAATAVYKSIAVRIGVAAGTSATGIGVPIGLLIGQGIMQRSSRASRRLRKKSPELYRKLRRKGDLQLLYFIVERPLEKYVEAIALAERSPKEFREKVDSIHSSVTQERAQ